MTEEAHLHNLYIVEKKSIREIGLIIGKSPVQIGRYLKKYRIPTRPFSTKGLRPRLGAILSQETKDKIAKGHRGKKLSLAHRNKVIKTLRNGKREENPNWKGGSYIDDKGYRIIRTDVGYNKEHRIVIETYLGRKLKRREHVHHLNGNKLDNRLENLMILNPEDHAKVHNETKDWIRNNAKKKSIIKII